jgi:hypothetical protein
MKFQPGQNRIQKGRTTYIRDVVQTQVDPPKKEIIQPKEEIKQPKKEKDESIQHGQMVQKPVSKGSKPVRRKGRPSSKSNGSSNSGS